MLKTVNFFLLFVNGVLLNLPSSKTLRIYWNFGSILGIIMVFQILTGTFLVFYYTPDRILSFSTVQYIIYEVNFGWVFRIFHFNGASLFFIFLYLHIFKGLFFSSYRLNKVWLSGLTLYLLIIIEAFIGYVLVWAQMRFWAAVVITRLLSVIPFWGSILVFWIWRGFGVTSATLKFFFTLHFLLPWMLLVLILLHLIFLHRRGRTSLLYCHGDFDKMRFFPIYWSKDMYNLIFWLFFLSLFLFYPFILGDPEMFIEANPIVSPVHIVPEWYFLFAYAILRAIPNKVVGVLALLLSIFRFYFFGMFNNYVTVINKLNVFLVFLFIIISFFLSWLGQCTVEVPYTFLGPFFSLLYFLFVYILLFIYYFSYYLFVYIIIFI